MGRLFWKFFIFFFLAQLVAVVGVGLSVWWQVKRDQTERVGVEATRPARTAVEAAASTLQYGGVAGLTQLLASWQQQHIPQVYVVDAAGRELMQRTYSNSAYQAARKLADKGGRHNIARYIALHDGQRYLLFVPEAGPRLAKPPLPPRFLHIYPIKPLFAGALASLLFAAILAWYFSKPIKSLRYAFQQASDGNLDVRVSSAMNGRSDELADLGHDFDAMAGRLGSLLQGQTRLLHHVSHELRSPLARIQMALGLAQQHPKNIDAAITRIELEASRMDKMVGELLALSRIESGVVQLKKESVELYALLDSLLEDAQFEASEKRLRFQLDAVKTLLIQAQADLLYRALENVVRNAVKYAPYDSLIRLSAHADVTQKQVIIAVQDEGEGVLDSELTDIFKPFVRASSGSQMHGHGVGLAITKQIVEAHGGEVSASNIKPVGFKVQLTLPR